MPKTQIHFASGEAQQSPLQRELQQTRDDLTAIRMKYSDLISRLHEVNNKLESITLLGTAEDAPAWASNPLEYIMTGAVAQDEDTAPSETPVADPNPEVIPPDLTEE